MLIELHQEGGTRYRSTVHRPDGAVVTLLGGSWNRVGGAVGRVPHDLAHLVVETEFGLEHGLWGTLAAGGLVKNASVTGGRRPPHGARRSKAVLDAAAEALRQAEVLVRALADAGADDGLRDLGRLRRHVSDRYWTDALTAASRDRADAALRAEAAAWAAHDHSSGPYVREWPRT